MLGRKGTNDRKIQRLGEGGPASRCARLPRGWADRGRNGAADSSSTPGSGLKRCAATLTLVLTSAAVSVLSGVAVAGSDEPAVSRPPEGMHGYTGEPVGPPVAPTAYPNASPPPTPRTSSYLPPATQVRLNASFRLAVRFVREAPTCQALFQSLGANGEEKLARTVFERAGPRNIEVCVRRHAWAFTRLGTSTTWICPVFDQLVSVEAALILIHEALHFAGLPELPGTPGALESAQIQAMVAANCAPARLRQPRGAATQQRPLVAVPPDEQQLPRSPDPSRSR